MQLFLNIASRCNYFTLCRRNHNSARVCLVSQHEEGSVHVLPFGSANRRAASPDSDVIVIACVSLHVTAGGDQYAPHRKVLFTLKNVTFM